MSYENLPLASTTVVSILQYENVSNYSNTLSLHNVICQLFLNKLFFIFVIFKIFTKGKKENHWRYWEAVSDWRKDVRKNSNEQVR